MAQTELMLRLIKDGKIVGYARLQKNNIGFFPFQTSQTIDDEFQTAKYPLEIDSCELGIKDGDEWQFDGDVIENLHGKCILFFDRFSFGIEDKMGNKYYYDELLQKASKKVGTIHDKNRGE